MEFFHRLLQLHQGMFLPLYVFGVGGCGGYIGQCGFVGVVVSVAQLLQAVIAHEYIQPAFKIEYLFLRQRGKRFEKYLLHGIFGQCFVLQVLQRHPQQQGSIALQQVSQPLIVATPAICMQDFFVGEGAMLCVVVQIRGYCMQFTNYTLKTGFLQDSISRL